MDIRIRRHQFRRISSNSTIFAQGVRDGLPIGLGYFAVAFSLGIAGREAGLTPFQGFLASILCNASAGEHAGFTLIAAGATYLEVALITFITNARYLLMSCAMSQRMAPGTSLGHRLLMAFDITDELFGINIARPGYMNPYYTYGAMLAAMPLWASGTALGVAAGNLLPQRLVSAFGVALYGMFLAVIIPPARKSRVIAGIIAVSFLASWATSVLPVISGVAGGTRTIILTVAISAVAAVLFPRKEEQQA